MRTATGSPACTGAGHPWAKDGLEKRFTLRVSAWHQKSSGDCAPVRSGHSRAGAAAGLRDPLGHRWSRGFAGATRDGGQWFRSLQAREATRGRGLPPPTSAT